MINFNGGQYLLDGKDLYIEYGFIIATGKSDLLQFPKAKERYSYNWPDENGLEYDLEEVPVFDDPVASLSGHLIANSEVSFLTKRYKLFQQLRKKGLRKLKAIDISEEFDVFYLSSESGNMSRKIKDSTLIAWPLTIQLQTVNYVNDINAPQSYVLGIKKNDLLGINNITLIKTK